ncbi:MAG: phosphoadenosine phosphosulfate reductase family protein [Eubacterium sp.]
MKPKKYVVSLSGGKDSTAMLLRLIEEKCPIDYIIFCDTGLEFPQMYEHIDKLEKYIGRPIIRLKPEHDFEYYFFIYHPKRKNPELEKYDGMSWGGPRNRWCTAMLKKRVLDAYFKDLKKDYEIIEYIGIAADEPHRVKDACYPLVEWNMTEKDCLAYCYERGFTWSGLYEIFHRVSCWCCPLQSLDELRKLRKHFPELWQQLEFWDKNTWRTFKPGYSVQALNVRFDFEEDWQTQGKSIHNKEFYTALKNILKEVS